MTHFPAQALLPKAHGELILFLKAAKCLFQIYNPVCLSCFFEGAVETPTGIVDESFIPSTFSISQNYPNPFNPTTTIDYQLAQPARITLTIFNSAGQVVRNLVNAALSPGSYQVLAPFLQPLELSLSFAFPHAAPARPIEQVFSKTEHLSICARVFAESLHRSGLPRRSPSSSSTARGPQV